MRRLLFVVTAVVLSVVSLACGGGDAEETSPESALAQVAANTAGSGAARVSSTVTRMIESLADPLTMTGEGVVDFASQRSQITMDLSELAAATGGLVGGEMESRLVDLVIYMRFPPGLAQLPSGKSWVRLDLRAGAEALGIDVQALMQQAGTDPTQWLDFIESAGDDFTVVGEEEVRGVPTTHYRGTIDFRKLAAEGPENLRETYESMIELSGVDEVRMEIWLDDEGRARRYEYDQPLPSSGTVQGTQTVTTEYYDFGVEVDVEPPPADQVIDVSELP